MKVHWTDTVIDHLSGNYDYIALDAEEYAKRMVDRLTRRAVVLPIPGEWYRNLRTS